MSAHLSNARPGPVADHHAFVGQAAQIQLQQAGSVFAQLDQAAATLKAGIQGLRTDAGAAAEAAIQVAGRALEAGFSRECQAGISQILATVNQAVRKVADILAAFAPLQASFVNCTSQATALAGDVRRAALNAQIFAIHAPDGATLEVLAGRVRTISDETLLHVDQLGTALHQTDEMVNNLRERLADFQQLGLAEHEILADESRLSLQKLADLEAAIPELIARITRQQEKFGLSAGQVLAAIQFPVTVAAASLRSATFFCELVAWSGAQGAGRGDASVASRQLDQLKSKYTMESERRAHASAVQPIMAGGATPAAPAISATGHGLAAATPSPHPATDRSGATGPDTPEMSGPEDAPVPTPEPAAVGADLGDNVELF
jgi:hypothetical protein